MRDLVIGLSAAFVTILVLLTGFAVIANGINILTLISLVVVVLLAIATIGALRDRKN